MLQYRLNSSDKKGATMIELMAMLAILGLGVSAMFAVVTSGIYFAKDTEDTIKAINLAREGIEWVTNIRNTNWLRFSSDRTNCWKAQGYDGTCIWSSILWDRISSGSSILYTANWLWNLSWSTVIDATTNWSGYAATYAVAQDGNWFFNQTGTIVSLPVCTATLQKNCRAIFTREIIIAPPGATDTGTLYVRSIVKWNTKSLHSLELQTTLTNWKAKF